MSMYHWLLRYNRYLPFKRWIHKNIVTPMPFRTKNRVLSLQSFEESMQTIRKKIQSGKPFMLGRYGFTELRNISRVSTEKKRQQFFEMLCTLSGFFPQDITLLPQFIDLYNKVEQNLDIVLPFSYANDYVHNERKRIALLEQCEHICDFSISGTVLGVPKNSEGGGYKEQPYHSYQYFAHHSYLSDLQNKNVLVISPFKSSILSQYTKLVDLGVLMPFKSLHVLRAVQTLGHTVMSEEKYNTWFDALEDMHQAMKAIDFDVVILGCGAYGLPLASYAKDMGKQALHLGGGTQLLFAIKGKRWEEVATFEDFWVSPSDEEKPKDYLLVEGGCYW